MDPLADGIPDAVRTIRLERTLAVLRTRFQPDAAIEPVEPVESPEAIARHVADAVRGRIETEPDDERRIALANRVLALLEADVSGPLNRLMAFTGFDSGTMPHQLSPVVGDAAHSTSLATALRTELASADRVDLLCGLIRRDGLRLLDDPLNDLRRSGVPFRVIATARPGATDRTAIDHLVEHVGAEVRIGYGTAATRPQAKAWLFHRTSGDDTAFVGSANLSRSSLIEGMEWTLRLSGIATPGLLRKFQTTFDGHWTSGAFLPYDPARDAARLDAALTNGDGAPPTISHPGLDVRPLPHQQEALAALDVERDTSDRHRNLIVAATGTGKTVLAALDYRRLRERRDASLLVVVARDAALAPTLRTFREILGDEKFGAIHIAGKRPRRRHLFASIDGLAEHGIEELPAARFDVVVVDGFDPAAAQAYARLLTHLRPKELLSLTVTPDDDLVHHFDGRAAYELPLCDAVAAELLVPVRYHGIADGVDLSDVDWKLGAYDAGALDARYVGNDARAAIVLAALRENVSDVDVMRAVGWCVSDSHAAYMARVASESGIPAVAIAGGERDEANPAQGGSGSEQGDATALVTSANEAVAALRAGEVRVLFTADEGAVDIPEVDTVLLLWPTDNPAWFLRQLGVGLRRAPGKAALTVLDFIGTQRQEFRFDLRYRALTGASRRALRRQVEQGFPALPSGSRAVLDDDARRIVLANLGTPSRLSRGQLAADVRSHGDLSLATYLREADRELSDVYRNGGTWTSARRAAGFATPSGGKDEDVLLRRVAAFAHVDDAERADVYRRLVDVDGPRYGQLTEREQRLARMLLFTVWPKRGAFASYPAGLAHLRRHRAVCAEIAELIDVALDRARHVPAPLDAELAPVPLASHASFLREEVLAALGYATSRRPPGGHTAGAAWCPAARTDALLVTPGAGEPLSTELFRWRPRHRLSTSSAAGQRYLRHHEQGSHVVLFVRETSTGDGPAPFRCLGQVSYVEHEDDPVSITWRLHRPMPSQLVRDG